MLKRLASLILSIFIFIGALYAGGASQVEAAAAEDEPYEIYPIPQHQTYLHSPFVMTEEVNVVIEAGIDEATRNFANQIMNSKSLRATFSQKAAAGKTNILIGTKGSADVVDAYFEMNIAYDASIFDEEDAYVLAIDKASGAGGVIAILGASTDAAYYALATLKMIFDQVPGKELQSVKYEDYADSKWRGFIEGFYGFPWSHEDRISLMRFGGQIKMNSYIFAPKDDKYHNSAWRTLYPAEELAKVKELVDVGHESKTQFVWAIHPGLNMINWNKYEAELQTLLAKLEQLYSVGVRQFGLFMDDISTSQSLTDKDKHVRLVTDVANWVSSKGDVKSLIYCPPFYNQAWTGEGGKPYLQALRSVPEHVEIMWTGRDVIGSVNETDNEWVKKEIGRDPYIWFNYPVNGYKKNRLLLGQVTMLEPGTHNFSGIVSNPLEQAELSKMALFGVADYTWNTDAFNRSQSWLDSFKYIEPDAAEEYRTIAYHMSDPSPNGRGVVLEESGNLKEKLDRFLRAYSDGAPMHESGSELLEEFGSILQAIQQFKAKVQHASLLEEIDPWLSCLSFVVQSDYYAVQSAMAMQNSDLNTAWEALAKASAAMSESKKFTREVIDEKPQVVEAGAKRLAPFAAELIQKLDVRIFGALDPEYMNPAGVSSYGAFPDLMNMLDGNKDSYFYMQKVQVNGDWYGVDFDKPIKVRDIEIIQGRTDADHDIFQRGILEYSVDGQNWTAIGEERSGYRIAASGLDLEARYVRYRLTHAGIPGGKPDLWTAVREFTVNGDRNKAAVYTNMSSLAGSAVESTEMSAALSGVGDITLQPFEYAGIRLASIENIAEIVLRAAGGEAVLESSVNGVEWQAVEPGSGEYPSAAYIRLINKGGHAITLNVELLQATFQKFAEPVVTHNYEGVYEGKLSAVFDGNMDEKVWFRGRQTPGRFVQVDMGGIVNVQNAGVVINDGEGDYFRQGDLQLSVDGLNWETIHTFSNPESRDLNFPEHIAPYRYKRVQVDNKPAIFIRLYTTVDNAGWLALNEILVNEGIERPGAESPVIQAQPPGDPGNEAIYAADRKLSTYYTAGGGDAGQPGYLNYKLYKYTELSQLVILQNPGTVSNAAVSIRDTQGWHSIGRLSQAYNVLDTSAYEHVLEVRLEWDGAVKPAIHEIIPVRKDSGVNPVAELAAQLAAPGSVIGGEVFDVQFGLKNVENPIYAQDVTISYDPGVMEFISARSVWTGVNLLMTNTDKPGTTRMIVVSEGAAHAVTNDAFLLELSFRARLATEPVNSIISVSKAIAGDGEGIETEAEASFASIQVSGKAGIPGDVNDDGIVSVGDLAIVAAHYGKDSSSPDWDKAKRADMNNDGKIDLYDLAFIARLIVES